MDRVIIGDIENSDLPLPEKYFDCIIFNDVLGHLKYPWIVLRNVKRYLVNDGYIVASIPNMRYLNEMKHLLIHNDWHYVSWGVRDKDHLRFFTYKSIKDMFEACGYQIMRIEGINSLRPSWKFRILNLITLNKCTDMKFLQFACLAQNQRKRES